MYEDVPRVEPNSSSISASICDTGRSTDSVATIEERDSSRHQAMRPN